MEQSWIGRYDSALYDKDALEKAAFKFIDDWYVHLALSDNQYEVRFTPKAGQTGDDKVISEFENELLAQNVRLAVYRKTHTVREVLMARAMASTMVVDDQLPNEVREDESQADEEDLAKLDSIVKNWFK